MKKEILIFVSIALMIAVVFFGFDKHEDQIEAVSTEYTVVRTANYSKYSVIDEMWNHWTEEASLFWFVASENGEIVNFNCPKSKLKGLKCDVPPKIKVSQINFNSYSIDADFKIVGYTPSGEDVSVSIETYNKFIKNSYVLVNIKTFYGITYGSELIKL